MTDSSAAPDAAPPRFLPSGDTALVVEFGDRMDRQLSARVLNLRRRLRDAVPPGMVEAVPTFRSLLVHYDPMLTSAAELKAEITRLAADLDSEPLVGHRWIFPTSYDDDLAPDLGEVAATLKIDRDEVVRLHAATPYLVYVIGFLPGLPYMGELSPRLVLPRRTTPRIAVPAGSVAIATNQTCVYPQESPGGWHLIGRTPVPLFEQGRSYPVLLSPGDTVRFVPVGRSEYDALAEACGRGGFDIERLRDEC